MSEKIKFAVVGFGHIGKRHATMIKEHPEAELVGVADINEAYRAVAEKEYNTHFYSSLDDLLNAGLSIDVLNVCTPNGLHAQQALDGLQHHCHVVIEKPMGLNRANCEEVLMEALNQARQVFIVKQNRYSPPAKWLKTLIDENRLGKVFMVQVNCYWNRDDRYYAQNSWKGTLELDGGPLFTQFSHFVDIMYWLFGDIRNIQARFENFNHDQNTEFEDSGFVNFEFVKGGLGEFNYSTSVANTNFESSITIIAEKGTVKVGGQYMDKIEYCDVADYERPELEPSNPPNDYGAYKGSAANHHYVIQNVIDTLRGKGTISTNAMEGMKVVEMIERIYEQRTL